MITRKEKPDLILLDILLPKKNGLEVLKEMQADPELQKIPVIAISNSGEQNEIDQAKTLGATDFLIKAIFDSNDVVKKVEEALGHSIAAGNPSTILPINQVSRQVAVEDTIVTTPDTSKPAPVTPTTTSSSLGKTILIVEDDKFLRELATQKLRAEGFQVLEAENGEEALEMMQAKDPSLVILDLILPGIDGFQVLTKIKSEPKWASLPVIILSNLGQEDDIAKAKSLGATDYLVKAHFSFGEIIKKIKTVLGM